MKKILNILQDNLKEMINLVKGLPLFTAILVVVAIIVIPDPLIILGSVVIKKLSI